MELLLQPFECFLADGGDGAVGEADGEPQSKSVTNGKIRSSAENFAGGSDSGEESVEELLFGNPSPEMGEFGIEADGVGRDVGRFSAEGGGDALETAVLFFGEPAVEVAEEIGDVESRRDACFRRQTISDETGESFDIVSGHGGDAGILHIVPPVIRAFSAAGGKENLLRIAVIQPIIRRRFVFLSGISRNKCV